MSAKMKIKVIKKGERKVAEKAAAPAVTESRTKRDSARDVVSNVTSWVNDFQARKREETLVAFDQLFAAKAQPSEM